MAHTTGPWTYFVGNANGRGLIRIEQEGTGKHIASLVRGDEAEKNAALIAAAPELRNELALACIWLERLDGSNEATQKQISKWQDLLATIATL